MTEPAQDGPRRRPLGHWLLLLALVVMWGSSFMLIKIAVAAIPPATMAGARLVLAAAVLVAVALVLGKAWPRAGRTWLIFLAIAVTGNALPFYLIAWGQQRIDSALAGILMAIMPLTTLVLAHFFAGERLSRARGAGFVLGFLGIVVLVGPEALLELRGEGTALISQLAVLGGAVCYAVNAIVARHRPKGDAIAASAGVMLMASLIMVPAALLADRPWALDWPAEPLWAIVALGLVSTALATVVFLKLIAAAGPSFVSLINYLIPLWAVALGAVFLGERPAWTALAALALILSGIALSEKQPRPAAKAAATAGSD